MKRSMTAPLPQECGESKERRVKLLLHQLAAVFRYVLPNIQQGDRSRVPACLKLGLAECIKRMHRRSGDVFFRTHKCGTGPLLSPSSGLTGEIGWCIPHCR
jgi:hypothetical protein